MQIAILIIISIISTCLSVFLLIAIADKINNIERFTDVKYCIIHISVVLILNIGVALTMGLYYRDNWQDIANVMLIVSVLWACAWVDLKCRIIPNKILAIGLLIRCALIAIATMLSPGEARYILVSSIVAALALFAGSVLCRLVSHDAIGFGDIKLLALMGFCLQNDRIWGAVLLSATAAFVYSLYLVIFKKANRKTEIPFAPLLLVGTIAASIITTV